MEYRRSLEKGGVYFFTLVINQRQPNPVKHGLEGLLGMLRLAQATSLYDF